MELAVCYMPCLQKFTMHVYCWGSCTLLRYNVVHCHGPVCAAQPKPCAHIATHHIMHLNQSMHTPSHICHVYLQIKATWCMQRMCKLSRDTLLQVLQYCHRRVSNLRAILPGSICLTRRIVSVAGCTETDTQRTWDQAYAAAGQH